MRLGNIGAVFLFEWKTALTVPRMACWAVLALFPVFIVTLIRISPAPDPSRETWAVILFALVPMLISMLGTFLWTTSVVSSELERKSWVYLAVRPNGSTAVLLGKYLAAVTWVISAALLGLTVSVLIAQIDDMWRMWTTLARLMPTARIMPISRVLSKTAISRTFAIPNAMAMKTAAYRTQAIWSKALTM